MHLYLKIHWKRNRKIKNYIPLNQKVIKRLFGIIGKEHITMEKITYSVPEAAAILGISKSYAYTLVKEKKLPVLNVGRRKIIPKISLETWIKENTVA